MIKKLTKKELNKTLRANPLFFERLINRRFSAPLIPYVAATGLSPNQISLISFLVGIAGIAFIWLGGYKFQVIGGLILLSSNYIDAFDGQIARLKNLTSKFGKYIDSTFDDIKESVVLLALAHNYFIQTGDQSIKYILPVAVIILLLSYLSATKIELAFGWRQVHIKKNFPIRNKFLNTLGHVLAEIYPTCAYWIWVFLALVFNQILIFFWFVIISRFSLFVSLMFVTFWYERTRKF